MSDGILARWVHLLHAYHDLGSGHARPGPDRESVNSIVPIRVPASTPSQSLSLHRSTTYNNGIVRKMPAAPVRPT